MTSKSKAKGNSWELECSKFLSEKYQQSFIRVPSSGAFIGGKNTFRKNIISSGQVQSRKGDIQPPDEWVHWNCECKSYAKFPFHQLWTGDVKMLDLWIEQVKEVADEGDLNLIFIKISRMGTWVVYEDGLGFQSNRSIAYKGWQFTSWDDFWTKDANILIVKQMSTKVF